MCLSTVEIWLSLMSPNNCLGFRWFTNIQPKPPPVGFFFLFFIFCVCACVSSRYYSSTDIVTVILYYLSMFYIVQVCSLRFRLWLVSHSHQWEMTCASGFYIWNTRFCLCETHSENLLNCFLCGTVYFYTSGVPEALSPYVLVSGHRKMHCEKAHVKFCLSDDENTLTALFSVLMTELVNMRLRGR